MTTPHQPRSILQRTLSAYLFVENYSFDELVRWCQDAKSDSVTVDEFKAALRCAVRKTINITPEVYERWTHDDSLETQEAVDKRLKELWNACFPAEAIR